MPLLPLIDSAQVCKGVKGGDRSSEEQLYGFLRGIAMRTYQQDLGPLAEDYLQELVTAVVEGIRRDQVEHPDSRLQFAAYCKRTMANIRIDGIRRAARQARRLIEISEGQDFRAKDDIEAALIWQEQYQIALKLIEGLPDPTSRFIVIEMGLRGRPMRDIERDTGLTSGQIRGLKQRALERLKEDYHAMTRKLRVIPGGRGGFRAAA